MSEWSAIAYGRTYEVDYRFLAIPQDFTREDCEWAKKYIVATMHYRENLKNLRWSMFKNQKYCVIGLTCRVSNFINSNDNIQFDISADKHKRPIYVFVGYVAKLDRDKKLDYIPDFCEQISASLKVLTIDIYNHFCSLLNYDSNSKKPLIYSYEYLFDTNINATKIDNYYLHFVEVFDFSINEIKNPILSHNQETSTELWKITAEYILISQYTTSNQDISLCINAENNKYILTETPFIAATVRKMVNYPHQHPANNNNFDNSNYNQRSNSSLGATPNVSNKQNQSLIKKFNVKKINLNRKKIIRLIGILFLIQLPLIFILNNLIILLLNTHFLPIVISISSGIFILGILVLSFVFDMRIG